MITGHILVQSGITLTIGAGDRLLFDGPYYLKIEGTLRVEGTADRRVVFTSRKSMPAVGDWIGIHVLGSSASSISYSIIEYAGGTSATLVGSLYLKNGAHVVDNITLRKNNAYPLIISDGDNVFQNSTVTDNQVPFGESVVTLEGNLGTTNFISNVVTLNRGSQIIKIAKSGQRHLFRNNRLERNTAIEGGILYLQGTSVEITSNSFVSNTSSLRLGSSVINVQSEAISTTISCNTFVGNQVSGNPPQDSATIYVSYDNQLVVSQNNFYPGMGYYEVSVGPFASTDIDATNNYWGTTNQSDIASLIYDFYDDFNLGKVNFTPFLVVASACAPQSG